MSLSFARPSSFLSDPMISEFEDPLATDVSNWSSFLGTPRMNIDVVEKGDHYTACVDLPGFEKEDINVSMDNFLLTIDARKKNIYADEENINFRRRERAFGHVKRTIRMPSNVNPDVSDCEFVDGVLMINLPKLATAKGHKKLTIA